jgi:hypothetical protein
MQSKGVGLSPEELEAQVALDLPDRDLMLVGTALTGLLGILQGTLADPVGTVTGAAADPVGTVTGVLGALGL